MRTIFNKAFIAVATAVALGTAGCEKIKDFGDTNVNPNGTEDPVTAALLTRVIAELGGREGGIAISAYTRPGYYAQYFSETQYPAASLYSLPKLEFSTHYNGFLYDLENIIIQNTNPATKAMVEVSGSNANQIAVARILKAYSFWTITDRWGDVPYSEALTGKPAPPKYDKQEDIYKSILEELTEAVDGFDNGLPMKGDAIYAGNIDNWRRFANSLRMQIALRMSKVYPAPGGFAAQQFTAALNHPAGSIEANSQNAAIDFPGGAYQNPWYVAYVFNGRIDDALSSTMANTLADLDDPRVKNYGTTAVGFPYGLDRPSAVAVAPGWGLVLAGKAISDAADVMILNAGTVLLARAEAAELGWTSEDAASLYTQGVTAGLKQWDHKDEDVTAYLSQAGVAYGATDHLKKIGTQKWIAMYPDGMQAWAEWKRTGFPALTPAEFAGNDSEEIPRRFVYGNTEYATNNDNVKAASALLEGGDTQDARMWWDVE